MQSWQCVVACQQHVCIHVQPHMCPKMHYFAPPPQVWCQDGNKGLRTWASSSALPSRLVWRPIRIIMRRLHPHLSCRLPVRADLTSS